MDSMQYICRMHRNSVGSTATNYGLDVTFIESWWGRVFRTRLYRTSGPPCLLYGPYRISFPGLKRPGCGVDHPLPYSPEVKERAGYTSNPPLDLHGLL